MICHHCKAEIKIGRYVSRSEECPACGADVHCCLNCSNYDPSAHNRCRDPLAEWVSDREKSNYCDLFIPNKLMPGGSLQGAGPDPRKTFDSLFKK
jgi:hypothetical protein